MLKTLAVTCATISHHQRTVVIAHPLSYPGDKLVVSSFPESPLRPHNPPAASPVCSSNRQLEMSSCHIHT